MLERRNHQHARIVGEDRLGAVAVMDVEIDDRHAFEAVRQRVRGADGDVVEQAESHRAVALGVVSGRTHRAERVAAFARQHEIGRQHDRARRVPRGVERMRDSSPCRDRGSAARPPEPSASISAM